MNLQLKLHIENKIKPLLNTKFEYQWDTISGGSINETYKITAENHVFFVKINTVANFKNGFKEEVLGLEFLADKNCLIPKIISEGKLNDLTYLVLDWVERGPKTSKFWQNFAHDLADLHRNRNEEFGLEYSNFMGRLEQKNKFRSKFTDFFIESRLIPQVKLAFNNGLLDRSMINKFENLYKQLPNIFPIEKPSALHGDLWSGNFLCSEKEKAVFIDPAVYFGHREVDLAMSLLFGGFSDEFYSIYHEEFPLQKDFFSRKDYYNLYPLLIHLNLFGSSYSSSIKAIIGDY